MSYNMFLDDTRQSHEAFFRRQTSYRLTNWVIVRSVESAIRTIEKRGMPNFISFDYDLEVGDSLPFVEFLKSQELLPGFDYDIHSANRLGYLAIKELMEELTGKEFEPTTY